MNPALSICPQSDNPGQHKRPEKRVWWEPWLVKPLQYLMDLMILTAAFVLAYLFRFDFDIPSSYFR
jgi:hypothetical protein